MPADANATLLPPAFRDLPGADLVAAGLQDVAAGRRTLEASLVQLAPVRLRRVGIELTALDGEAKAKVFALVVAAEDGSAHSRFNAVVDRLDSFLDGADHVVSR
jgi:hypothetical protein